MNALIGYSGGAGTPDGGHDDRDGRAWFDQNYRQYLKWSEFRLPAMTWVTLDEHPDSINDSFFIVGPGATQWGDLPSSLHGGACGFSFADGHSETHRWHDGRTTPPLVNGGFVNDDFSSPDNKDVAWLQDRASRPKN